MAETVYTNYWENELTGIRKEHGTYKTEEEALNGIKVWWEIHDESYPDAEIYRTNTDALEIKYGTGHYFYRIESRKMDGPMAKTSYTLKNDRQIQDERKKYDIDEDEYLFDQLAEPYRDRLILAYNDIEKARNQVYQKNGRPIKQLP